MAPLENYSTSGLSPRRRVEFWNDLASRTYTPVSAEPKDPRRFSARLARARLGELGIGLVRSDPTLVRHSDTHVACTRHRVFFLQFQLDGRSLLRQDDREALLEPGDFTLVDNSRPFLLSCDGECTLLVLGIPDRSLRRYIACPDDVVAISMPYRENLNRLLLDFAQGVWRQCCAEPGPEVSSRLARCTLELTASAYSVVPQAHADRSALAQARRARILSYVERHLSKPDLSPSSIAAALRMTKRYLHLLFAGEPETLSRYILRRRLEECARALVSDTHPRRTVSAIAYDHGFASLTHFGKVFREQYGMTPSEYRLRGRAPGNAPTSRESAIATSDRPD